METQFCPSPTWCEGVPEVRNRQGYVVWKPDSPDCRYWSIEAGSVIARSADGRVLAVHCLLPGESVESAWA
jgi:hypothetical protein